MGQAAFTIHLADAASVCQDIPDPTPVAPRRHTTVVVERLAGTPAVRM